MAPTILQLGTKGNSLTDIIITILYQHHPLTSKKIYHMVTGMYGISVSYQAVFKKLKEMCSAGIVKKQGMDYSLSIEWIQKLKCFAEDAENAYGENALEQSRQSIILTFQMPFEALTGLLDMLVREYGTEQHNDVTIVHWAHPWPIIGISKTEFDKIKSVMCYGKHYGLCRNNTVLDKWLAKFWEDMGKIQIYDPTCASVCDMFVFKDYVVQIFFEPETKKAIDNIFATTTDVNAFDAKNFYENMMGRKTEVTMIVTENKNVADSVRAATLSKFNAMR